MMRAFACSVVLALTCAGEAVAQRPDGHVSVGIDALPNADGAPVEARVRLFADEKISLGSNLVVRLAASLDWLGAREYARRRPGRLESGDGDRLRIVPAELHVEVTGARGDLRFGYSRVVWGRLDEVQPSDVVNPLDLAKYVFEGRAEARLAVPMVRGRFFFGERAALEAVLVPVFTRGRFDQLEEPESPFNLVRDVLSSSAAPGVPFSISRSEPATSFRNLQGGGRATATTGRVDWSAAVYRGFDPYGAYVSLQPFALTQVFPRYTMVAGDFETARGEWALRGEVARFLDAVDAFEGGVGVDRRAGEFHVTGTFLLRHEEENAPLTGSYTSASIVAAVDRSFARERYRTRTFGVYNATEGVFFARTIASMEVRTNVILEGSVGWFFGRGSAEARRDVLGRFGDRDFVYTRLRVHF